MRMDCVAQHRVFLPLGAIAHIHAAPSYSAILASYILKEELGHLGRVGCALCLLGALAIVLHAPEDKEITTVDEVLTYTWSRSALGLRWLCAPLAWTLSCDLALLACFMVYFCASRIRLCPLRFQR